MRAVLRRLDQHWFAPARLSDLALARIALVGFQLILLTVPALSERVGVCTGCSLRFQLWLTKLDPSQYAPLPALKVLLLPFGWGARPDPMFLQAVWLAAVLSGALALLGWHTRLSLLGFAASNTLLIAHAYSYRELHHPEAVMTIALWALALGPSGAAWSLDDLRARMRRSTSTLGFSPGSKAERSPLARWPLRLVQWVLAMAYFSAGLSKLWGKGLEWLNGYTLAYHIGQDAVERGSALGLWLSQHIAALRLLSALTISIELGFAGAILFPQLTWLFLIGGAGMHAAIYLAQRAPFPQFIVLYVVFAEAVRQHWPARRSAPAPAGGWTVIYDGLCPLCVRTMVVLDYLDLQSRLRFVDLEREPALTASAGAAVDEARHVIHVRDSAGHVTRGFFAFRELARALAPLWPIRPLLYLPSADRIGPWVYGVVARNRKRRRCRVETCAVGRA